LGLVFVFVYLEFVYFFAHISRVQLLVKAFDFLVINGSFRGILSILSNGEVVVVLRRRVLLM